MQTSTPRSMDEFRHTPLIPDQVSPPATSPISSASGMSDTSGVSIQLGRTNVSDPLDKIKLTPDKPISTSIEETRLAKGARDLSAGIKKSNSLPNLSWDNIENALFTSYPTRNRENIIRPRPRAHSISGVGDVDFSQWTDDDFEPNSERSSKTGMGEHVVQRRPGDKKSLSELEEHLSESNKSTRGAEQGSPGSNKISPGVDKELYESNKVAPVVMQESPESNNTINGGARTMEIVTPTHRSLSNGILGASPLLKSMKRVLRISPSTPIGLARKLQLRSQGQDIKPITFGEDVEMTDLEFCRHQANDLGSYIARPEPSPVADRKIIKGFRRRLLSVGGGCMNSDVRQNPIAGMKQAEDSEFDKTRSRSMSMGHSNDRGLVEGDNEETTGVEHERLG